MTPKEKAHSLYEEMFYKIPSKGITVREHDQVAAQCALIAVNELVSDHGENGRLESLKYWKDVKLELEKL